MDIGMPLRGCFDNGNIRINGVHVISGKHFSSKGKPRWKASLYECFFYISKEKTYEIIQ